MEVEVIRSSKRRKTIEAAIRDGRMVIRIPARLSPAQEKKIVEEMRVKLAGRLEAGRKNIEDTLKERAQKLNRRYFKGVLKIGIIKFVTNQNRRFGSCTINSGDIRISHRLMKAPLWVLDYVIMHEISHLIHPDHSKAFWECVNRYPHTERARGYLIAVSHENDDTDYK